MFSIHRTQSPADVLGLISSSPASVRYPHLSGMASRIGTPALTFRASSAMGLQLTHHCGFMMVSTMSPDFLHGQHALNDVHCSTYEQMGICISLSFCST
jgi:hypothetical protein